MTLRQALAVASECAPLVKTGGLADVVGALPAAMAAQGWGMRTLIPGYRAVKAALPRAKAVHKFDDLLGQPARLLAARQGAHDILVLDAPALYERDGSPYLTPQGRDWPDNDLRFAVLCRAGALIAAQGLAGWRPEVVHLHDWQAGLVPAYLRALGAKVPCVLTIHNIAFHGLTAASRLKALDLHAEDFSVEGFEYYGHISALKAGLVWAEALTTVSPTYANELSTPDFGMGLEGVIRARATDLEGILNGIDTEAWNPATDPEIEGFKTPAGKLTNKKRLRREFGLSNGPGPLCIVVARLSDQKGLDLLLQALPALTTRGGQLALLGSGERRLENAWLAQATANPGMVGVRIGYDEGLAHRMFAGGDAVLVPSRFEPCGLTQLYGLRYGTLPVVARTGGLADTVIHANEAGLAAGVATGITHRPGDANALGFALAQLCDLWRDPKVYTRLQRNAMKHPVGWEASAPRYAALYDRLVDQARGPT